MSFNHGTCRIPAVFDGFLMIFDQCISVPYLSHILLEIPDVKNSGCLKQNIKVTIMHWLENNPLTRTFQIVKTTRLEGFKYQSL